MINIMIADDHAIVRAGLKQILSDHPDMTVIDEASDGQELLEKIKKRHPDVILLDISMPGRNGLEILKQIRVEKPALPVLVLSMHSEEQYAIRTIKAGAAGYLTKEAASEKLVEAIKKVHEGGRYISMTLAEKLAETLMIDMRRPAHENLTDREYQVFYNIACGKTVSEIASEMFLSVKTISTYRRRILNKMDMKNNSELTRYALENTLIE